MQRSSPVDGFRLAYDRAGSGPPVVLLHRWSGDRFDYREVMPPLSGSADVVVPDLRGFRQSDKHPEDAAHAYSAEAQARSVTGLIAELGLPAVVVAGYEIGSRVAQTIALTSPALVRAIVVSPPLPGAGDRVLTADAQREFRAASDGGRPRPSRRRVRGAGRLHRLDRLVPGRLGNGRQEPGRDGTRA